MSGISPSASFYVCWTSPASLDSLLFVFLVLASDVGSHDLFFSMVSCFMGSVWVGCVRLVLPRIDDFGTSIKEV